MPGVSVLIPYGYRSDWEETLLSLTLQRWNEWFPDWEVILGSDDSNLDSGTPFNRSRARNNAAAEASGDVFVIADADTTFFQARDVRVVTNFVTPVKWFLPSSYLQTVQEWTEGLVEGNLSIDETVKYSREYRDQPGGWRICHRSAFEAVGGFDEGFKGWGYEDTAFVEAMNCLVGPHKRGGTALHLWHPTSRAERQEHADIRHNVDRYARYRREARRSPGKMETLLAELGVKP